MFHMPGGLVDKKDQGDVRTRRAEIMTAEYSEHFRTVVADVFFILHIGVAGTDKRFPPMGGRSPNGSPDSFSLPFPG